MSIKRMIAVIAIFLAACGGWVILGGVTMSRSMELSSKLKKPVEGLWGREINQEAPRLTVAIPGTDQVRKVIPVKNVINVKLINDPRKKGLIWYPTFVSEFDAIYTLRNEKPVEQKVRMHFDFPDPDGTYNNFKLAIDGEEVNTIIDTRRGIDELIALGPEQERQFHIHYETRGKDTWRYLATAHAGQVQGLQMNVTTNFAQVDYPEDCRSPMSATAIVTHQSPGKGPLQLPGKKLAWNDTKLITSKHIGVVIPEKLNPGPVTSRITFFAPVCLLFFFVLVATINILYKVEIHPMHYLFVAAGFFAFHLLMCYMVGIMPMYVAFAISAVVSVVLVTAYLAGALKKRFPWKIAAAGQLFFLVLFSYTFFWKGMTGLTVAVGSVVTLAVLMKVTAHIDWNTIFVTKPKPPLCPPLPKKTEAKPA